MSTNRSAINDTEIVRSNNIVDKGLPIPFLEKAHVVEQGWCSVISEGGAFKEILGPGHHFMGRYHMFRQVKATKIDMRMKNMVISTNREFTISQPVPVEINLDLSVEYRVSDPRRVAMEIEHPLVGLFDRVIQAVRGSVVYATVDEIRTQGEGIARSTLQRLQAMQLPVVLGLEVLNVMTTSIKATDVGNDALGKLQMAEFVKVQDWRVDNAILQQTQVTPQWLMINRPDLYKELMAGNQAIIKEMVDKGLLDPAGFLNQSTTAPNYNPANLISGMGIPGMVMPGLPNPVQQPPNYPGGPANPGQPGMPQLPGGPQGPANPPPSPARDIHSRMREEIPYLERMPGAKIDSKAGTDERGIPDGSYNLLVRLPRISGGQIEIYFTCTSSYPQTPPAMEVEISGEPTPFQSAILRRWTGQYLVEIVREVKQFFG